MARLPSVAVLAALVAVSSVVRAWAGLRVPTPWIAADEMIYAELGRSLWESGRLSILGADTPFYSLVHPALIGLPLALFDTATGYDVARVLQALAMSMTAVPVFLWGRRLMPERWALAAATLTLVIPGLAYIGLLMTETVFYPVMTVVAWTAARALVHPTAFAQGALVIAVVLAVLTRLQGVVAVPAFVLAVLLYAALTRSRSVFTRVWAAVAALVVVGAFVLVSGLGAYEPVGTVDYSPADALRFALYHAGDSLLLVGIAPACAVVLLLFVRERDPELDAYLAVTLALWLGLVLQVGLFASRYVGRLAERDLLTLAPLFFLGLCAWLARGAPRTRRSTYGVVLGAAALVLTLPLGKLVHAAALPDAFTLVPVWELGEHEAVVWGFTTIAVLAIALLPRRALVLVPAVLAVVFVVSSVLVSRHVEREAKTLRASFFGAAAPNWVDTTSPGRTAYFYDGEPHWNAVWSYLFWNRDVRRVLVLNGAPRIPGPVPQTRVDPFPVGELGTDARFVVGSTAFTFYGTPVASVEQVGLVQSGLALWETTSPLRLQTTKTGVQPLGDIAGRASMDVYGCAGGRFELTLVAKGSPVTVRLDSGFAAAERTLQAAEVWEVAVAADPDAELCSLTVTPDGLVGSTRFEYVR